MTGWKTVAYGLLIAITAALSSAELQQLISENIPVVGGAIGTGIVILRALTSSSIFKKAVK